MKKILQNKKLVIILSVVLAVIIAAGVGILVWQIAKDDSHATHEVLFLDGEDREISRVSVESGQFIDPSDIPMVSAEGLYYKAWYKDKALSEPIDPMQPITQDLTCYPLISSMGAISATGSTTATGLHDSEFRLVLCSEEDLTQKTVSDYLKVTSLFGELPELNVISLGEGKYRLDSGFEKGGHYDVALLDESISFEGYDSTIRNYNLRIAAPHSEIVEVSDDIVEIPREDLINIQITNTETNAANAVLYADAIAVGSMIKLYEAEDEYYYYKIESIRSSTEVADRGKILYDVSLIPCTFAEIYDKIDLNMDASDIEEEIELADFEQIKAEIEDSEQMKVWADYIAMAINDTPQYQSLVASGTVQPMGLSSATMSNLLATNTDPSIQPLAGFTAGENTNLQITVDRIKLDTNKTNDYWYNYILENRVGIEDEDGNIVPLDPKEGANRFYCLEVKVTFTYIPNMETNLRFDATITFKQWFRINKAIRAYLKLDIFDPDLAFKIGTTTLLQTSVAMDITMSTDGGYTTVDISKAIEEAMGKSEAYHTSKARFVEMFRKLYDGGKTDELELYRHPIAGINMNIKDLIKFQIELYFFVKMDIRAGIGIQYDYYNTVNIGVCKEADSKKVRAYCYADDPAQEFTFYIAGHAGLRTGLGVDFSIGFFGLKGVEATLTAELGLYADFYGYYYINYLQPRGYSGVYTGSAGAYYFEMGAYAEVSLEVQFFIFSGDWSLVKKTQPFLSLGTRYVLMDFTDEDKNTFISNAKYGPETYESYVLDFRKLKKDNAVSITGQKYPVYVADLSPMVQATFMDLVTTDEKYSEKHADSREVLMSGIKLSGMERPPLQPWPDGSNMVWYYGSDLEKTKGNAFYILAEGLDAVLEKYGRADWEGIIVNYYGPSFAFASKPTYRFNLTVATGDVIDQGKLDDTHAVNYYVDGQLYESEKYVEGKMLQGTADVEKRVNNDKTFKNKHYITSVSFTREYDGKAVTQDMDIHAEVVYTTNPNVSYNFPVISKQGEQYYHVSSASLRLGDQIALKKGDSPAITVEELLEVSFGESADYLAFDEKYFLGWNLVGTDTSVLNDPMPSNDIPVAYEAIYSDQARYPISVTLNHVDVGGNLLSSSTFEITFGEELPFYCTDNYVELDGSHTIQPSEGEFAFEEHRVPISDVTITCLDTPNPIVTFIDRNGNLIYSGMWQYGSDVNVTSKNLAPKVLYDDDYVYTYVEWVNVDDPSAGTVVTKTATYQATYTATARQYQIVFEDSTVTASDGSVPVLAPQIGAELEAYVEAWIAEHGLAKPSITNDEGDVTHYIYRGYTLQFSPKSDICTIVVDFDETKFSSAIGVEFVITDGSLIKDGETVAVKTHTLTLNNGYVTDVIFTATPNDMNYRFVGWRFGDSVYTSISEIYFASDAGEIQYLTAVFEQKPLTVTLVDGDQIEVCYAEQGEAISLPYATKDSTAQYSYEFAGWRAEDGTVYSPTTLYTVTGNVTLTAQFNETVRNYTVTFDANGGKLGSNSIYTVSVAYGNTPTADTPTREATATVRYEFAGWSPELTAVTGEATYTAQWREIKLYTVTFDAGEGQFDSSGKKTVTITVDEGHALASYDFPMTPYKKTDAGYYEFNVWSPAVAVGTVIDGNVTCTATYKSELSTRTGITVSDGVNTEDIAAFFNGTSVIGGYTYVLDDEYYGKLLTVTAEGLTISGEATDISIAIQNVDVTLKNLSLTYKDHGEEAPYWYCIMTYGKVNIVIDGSVSIICPTDGNAIRGDEMEDPNNAEQYILSDLTLTGVNDGVLSIDSVQYGIAAYGKLTVNDLKIDLTVAPVYGDAMAMVIQDIASFNDSAITVNSGVLMASKLTLNDTSLSFTATEFTPGMSNGLYISFYNEEGGQITLMELIRSQISFEDGIAIAIVVDPDKYYVNTNIEFYGILSTYETLDAFLADVSKNGYSGMVVIDTASTIK